MPVPALMSFLKGEWSHNAIREIICCFVSVFVVLIVSRVTIFFVINNGHFLNWQNVYLVGNQLQFTSLNGTHILPRLCNPKLLFALFSNLKCLSSRQVNKCRRKKNPLNYDLHIPIAVLQRPVHVLQSWHYM